MFTGNPFAHFDPKNDTFQWERLNDIAMRARALLQNRTREEIEYAALVADWMLSDEATTDQPVPEVADQVHASECVSPVQLLRSRMGHFDISGLVDFPDATWPEFFAAFALVCLGEAAHISDPSPHLGDYADDLDDASSAPNANSTEFWPTPDELTLDAMEAVCFAESLSGKLPEIEALVGRMTTSKISVQNKSAGLKRYAKQGAVTQRFVTEFLAERLPGKSCADAATRFYSALPGAERTLYSEKNAARTLCEGIRRSRKQSSKAVHDYAKK